jgi:hypothetical protein
MTLARRERNGPLIHGGCHCGNLRQSLRFPRSSEATELREC